MTEREFVYWLQGYLEMADPKKLTWKQIQMIKDHLALVLNKVTPDRNKQLEFDLSRPRVVSDPICSQISLYTVGTPQPIQPGLISWDGTNASC